MSIATEIERLQTAKKNIKSAIEEKGVTVGDGNIDTYAQKIGEISVGGGDGWYDLFWDTYQANRGYKFSHLCWTDDIFMPKYNLVIETAYAAGLFQYSGITSLKGKLAQLGLTLDVSQCNSISQMFQGSNVKDVPILDARNCDAIHYVFGTSSKVETVDKLILSDKLTNVGNAFQNATNLTHIIFEGVIAVTGLNLQWSVLDVDSLRSLLNCLADKSADTSGTTWTVTVGSTNYATILEHLSTELEQAQMKGWSIS